MDDTRPAIPVHTVVGTRGRADLARSSDGVVSHASAHLYFAESEIAVPTGHGRFAYPLAFAELRRILHQELGTGAAPRAKPDLAARRGSGECPIAVNPVDTRVRKGLKPPDGEIRVFGWDAVGRVKAVGADAAAKWWHLFPVERCTQY